MDRHEGMAGGIRNVGTEPSREPGKSTGMISWASFVKFTDMLKVSMENALYAGDP